MADFARWAVACEPGFGVPDGTFLAAYNDNRKDSNRSAIEASVIGPYVLQLNQRESVWEGSPSELLAELTRLAPETVTKQGNWPKRANILSGKLLSITPNLRAEGIHVEEGKKDRGTKRYVSIYSLNGENSVPDVFSPRLTRNLEDAEDEEDAVSTDFKSTSTM